MDIQQSNSGRGDGTQIVHSKVLNLEEDVDESTTSNESEYEDTEGTITECSPPAELNAPVLSPELLKKMLKPYSKYCVLDQSFRLENPDMVSFKYFLKFMVISKRFVFATQQNVLYRFFVVIDGGSVCFYLKRKDIHTSRIFRLSFEKTHAIVKLLQPLLIAEINELTASKIVWFLKLIKLKNNKVGFHFSPSYAFAQFLIDEYWMQIHELRCNCADLTFGLPFKDLNKLQVYGVRSIVDLWPILRLNMNELNVQIASQFSIEDVETLPFKSGSIKRCELNFLPSVGELTVLRAVKFVTKCYPFLKLLVVNMKLFLHMMDRTERVIGIILEFYRNYKEVVQVCLENSINLKLEIQATFLNGRFRLLENWMNALMANNEFQGVKHETTAQNSGEVSTKFFGEDKHPNVCASFSIEMKYCYGDNFGDQPMQVLHFARIPRGRRMM